MKCKSCGNEYEDGTLYCPDCGRKTSQDTDSKDMMIMEEKKGNVHIIRDKLVKVFYEKWLMLAIALLLVVLLGSVIYAAIVVFQNTH